MNEETNLPWIDISGVNLYKLGEFSHNPRFVYVTQKEKEYLEKCNPIQAIKNAVDHIHNKKYADINNHKECIDCHEVKHLLSFSHYARKDKKKEKIMPYCKICQHIRHKKSYVTKEQKVALEIIKLIQKEQSIEKAIDAINSKYFPI